MKGGGAAEGKTSVISREKRHRRHDVTHELTRPVRDRRASRCCTGAPPLFAFPLLFWFPSAKPHMPSDCRAWDGEHQGRGQWCGGKLPRGDPACMGRVRRGCFSWELGLSSWRGESKCHGGGRWHRTHATSHVLTHTVQRTLLCGRSD